MGLRVIDGSKSSGTCHPFTAAEERLIQQYLDTHAPPSLKPPIPRAALPTPQAGTSESIHRRPVQEKTTQLFYQRDGRNHHIGEDIPWVWISQSVWPLPASTASARR
jgi:hypothetical protein